MRYLGIIVWLFWIAVAFVGIPASFAQDIEATAVPTPPIVTIADDPTSDTPVIVIQQPDQEGMSENVQVAIVFGLAAIATVAIIVYGMVKKKSPQDVWWSLPSPLTTFAGPAGWQYAMRQAQRTPDPADDNALIQLAVTLGYTVEQLSDGSFVLSKAHTPPAVG